MAGKTQLVAATILALITGATLALYLVMTTVAAPTPAPAAAVQGVLQVSPGAVSPDEANVSTADRKITIRLTDADLNTVAYVGNGPSGELPTFGTADGEQLTVTPGTAQGAQFIAVLRLNPIGPVRSTPLRDRNGDGIITIADVEIASTDVDRDGTAGDLELVSINDAATGLINLKALRPGLGGKSYFLRYATTTRQLTRALKTFTESLAAPVALSNGQVFTLGLKAAWLPLQDTNGDGVANPADIVIAVAGRGAADTPVVTSIGGTATLANTGNGSAASTTITLRHQGSPLTTGSKINLTYLGLADLVTVRGANNVDIPLRLRETGPDTGVFTSVIFAVEGRNNQHDVLRTCANLSCNLDPTTTSFGTGDRPTIAVINGGLINVAYGDRHPAGNVVARVIVEAEPPSFSNASPPDGAVTANLNTVLSVDVTDTIAGVNSTSDLVTGTNIPKSIGLALVVDTVPHAYRTGDIRVTETAAGSGVYRIEYNINNIHKIKNAIATNSEVTSTVTWGFVAKDKAGNGTGSGIRTLTVDNTSVVLSHAVTGNHWNTVTERLEGSRAGLPGTDKRTSIQVVFSKPMDGTSLDTGDFTVDGVNPISVAHFSDIATGAFLTVPAMAPDATPVVAIVGEVKDIAGNPLSSGAKTALDGMAPRLSATIANNLTAGEINLNVKSDELIAGSRPQIVVNLCTQFEGRTTIGDCTTKVTPATSTSIVVERAEWNFKLTGLATGRYNITGNASDVNVNRASMGNADATAPDALDFEMDKAIPAPVATVPTEGSTVGFVNPFYIELDWRSEGTEYTGDSHAKVQLTKGNLDGQNVVANAVTKDQRLWIIPIANIALGAHTLVFAGIDEAGNTSPDLTLSFTVDAPLVQGTVDLQGREDDGGATGAFLDGNVTKGQVKTIGDGSYAISPPPGVYTVSVSKEGFLTATHANVKVEADKALQLPLVRLLAGDVDGNGVIELKDVTTAAINLGQDSSPWP